MCGRVAAGVGVMGSVLTDLGEFSISSVGGGAPRASDGGCVLEVMHCDGEWRVAGEACQICSRAPLRFRLSGSSILLGGSLGFHATQVHIHHRWISGGFICIGCVPKW